MKTIMAKLGKMRKEQEWVVYAFDKPEAVTVQADTYIGQFNAYTGEGILSGPHSGGAYFPHLLRGKKYQFPRWFVEQATEAAPIKGDEVVKGLNIFWG